MTSKFTAALVQMRATQSPSENIAAAVAHIEQAASDGAHYVQTPEMTNILTQSRSHLMAHIAVEDEDAGLHTFRQLAKDLKIWLHIGSLALKAGAGDERAVNRGFLLKPEGDIAARYDKIHMFDVDLANGESYRESSSYRPGTSCVMADLPWGQLGMAICYDLRFPSLFRHQAHQGASLLTVPAAFTQKTGEAHWHALLRARAIENGAYVLASAQGGLHEDGRQTYGHSLICDPWGKVIAEKADDAPGVILAEIDMEAVAKARSAIPVLAHDVEIH